MGRICLVQGWEKYWAVIDITMTFRVPYNAREFLTNRENIGLLRRSLLQAVSQYQDPYCVSRRLNTYTKLCTPVEQ
jgi:hypothetical protein